MKYVYIQTDNVKIKHKKKSSMRLFIAFVHGYITINVKQKLLTLQEQKSSPRFEVCCLVFKFLGIILVLTYRLFVGFPFFSLFFFLATIQ